MIKNSYMLSYAYSYNLGESVSIRAGLKGGISRSIINFDKLTFGDQIDTRRGFIYETKQSIEPSVIYPDFGTGLLLSAKKFDIGLALDHINRPNQSHSKEGKSILPVLASIHGSYSARIENLNISPYLIIKKQQHFHHLILGTYIKSKRFFYGLAYYNAAGSANGANVSGGVNLKFVRVGYSYDVIKLWKPIGSHEIMLSFLLNDKKERQKLRIVHNPLFSSF